MRTGKQIFEKSILDNIDNTVEVLTIIDQGELFVEFKVCDPKWLTPGEGFLDAQNETWGVSSVDLDEFIVRALRPSDDAHLEYGATIYLNKPVFISGTPLNANQELTLEQEAGVAIVYPIVWLKESIRLKIPPQSASAARWFDFEWFCLMSYNYNVALNNDRHRLAIYPMTQLGQEILNTIDRVWGLTRESDAESRELSRFGKETQQGFESYLLQLNVSGTAYSAKIRVDEAHLCECN